MSQQNTAKREASGIGNVLRNNSWGETAEIEEEEDNFQYHYNTCGENRDIQEGSSKPTIGDTTIYLEEKMRRRLRFFFMNPIEKWQAKSRFPYKFLVQVLKIILVTVQLCLFAHNNYIHVNYAWNNRITFSHLFLRGWDSTQEVPAYPPATGPLAIYKQDEFFETIDYALNGYYNLSNAIGSYSYADEDNSVGRVVFCLYYRIFNNKMNETCLNITNHEDKSIVSRHFLEQNSIYINFSCLVKAEMKFFVKTINLKAVGPITPADCYKFRITILFDNKDFDGQMLLSLDAEPMRFICKGDIQYIKNNHIESVLRTVLNVFVIFICSLSLGLCSRAIYRAQLLKFETTALFKKIYGKPLSFEGSLEFLNLWYIMIIINDLLIIIGSTIKQQIENKQRGVDHWNVCSIFLGTGNLLVWFGVLRYLGFFKTYNVVILTLKKAAPKVARFLICAILIYSGFTFCGWLVLGPYHMKFRSLATTSECLFALINGDDMFATFSITSFKSPMLWWYSRIYLYAFISLYIYVVLSLFISVIMDAYDTIKIYYRDGFPKTDLQTFISLCTDDASSGAYKDDIDDDAFFCDVMKKLCCFYRKKEHDFNPLFNSNNANSDFNTESTQACSGATSI